MSFSITAAKKFRGRWRASGDKSITHRAYLFNALAHGEATIRGANTGEDCARSRELARAVGAEIESIGGEKGSWRIRGCGGRFQEPAGVLDAGNSGTTLRLACGLLAAQPFAVRLDGDASLRRRPMDRIAAPLAALGAELDTTDGGVPPLRLRGASLRGCEYASPIASAQVKTAFLLAALQAEGESRFREPQLSRDHSERLLARMGARIETEADGALHVVGPAALRAVDVSVPGDLSAAAFLVAGALTVEGGNVLVKNLGVNPTRTGFLDVIQRMGARFALYHPREEAGEPVADLLAQYSVLEGTEIAAAELPRLVDEIPILAVLAARANGRSRFRGLAELRVKESDRLARTAALVAAFGGDALVAGDDLIVTGGRSLHAADVDSGGDHRMAMAAAVLALGCRGTSTITDTDCVATSFPEFSGLMKRFTNGAFQAAATP